MSKSLLEQWMSGKPWEDRLMEEGTYFDPPDMTPFSRKTNDHFHSSQEQQQHGSVNPRRNGVTTRIFPSQSAASSSSSSSSSTLSSETIFDDTPASSSSTSCTSSISQTLTREESSVHKPSYMNLTESTKAKQRACGDGGSSYCGSDPSVNLWKGLCVTPQRLSYQKRNSGGLQQRVAITVAGLV